MRYILCEDGESGYYFWTLISEYVLKKDYHVITPSEIYDMINEVPKGGIFQIGVTKIRKFLQTLISDVHSNGLNGNTYIICIDNVVDNIEVGNEIELIQNIVEERENFHLVNYICFEQLVINSPAVLSFFPKLSDIEGFNVLKQHSDAYGLGHGRELKQLLKKNNIKCATTERIYANIIEKAVISSIQKFGRKDYIRAIHHYILKGKGSVCWTMDCTRNCPDDKCWEATGNNLMCSDCHLLLKESAPSCVYVNADVVRKYAEESCCNKQLPEKLEKRVWMMFGIKEVIAIDDY